MRIATAFVWFSAALTVALALLMYGAILYMAVSQDPEQMFVTGLGPWSDSLQATAGVVVALSLASVGLRLWHSSRWWRLGAVIAIAQVACVGWACLLFYREYF